MVPRNAVKNVELAEGGAIVFQRYIFLCSTGRLQKPNKNDLTLLGLQSRFGDTPVNSQDVYPQKGTAVLKHFFCFLRKDLIESLPKMDFSTLAPPQLSRKRDSAKKKSTLLFEGNALPLRYHTGYNVG